MQEPHQLSEIKNVLEENQEIQERSIKQISKRLRRAERAYHKAPAWQREARLQQLIERYDAAMQLYQEELSANKRAQLQEIIKDVQETINSAYSASQELVSSPPQGRVYSGLQDYAAYSASQDLASSPLKSGSLATSMSAPQSGPLALPMRPPLTGHFLSLPLTARVGLVVLVLFVLGTLTWIRLNPSLAEASCMPGSLRIDGSTALEPLVYRIAQDYMQACHGASIEVNNPGGASITGLDNVENKTIDIGDSDIFAFPAQSDLVDHQVAVVIFTLIVNQDVGKYIHNLSTDQVIKIFTGTYTNWQQVGGPDLPIIPLSRTVHSGTRYTFEQYILHGVQTSVGTVPPTSSTPEEAQEVANIPGSIGYTALDSAEQTTGVSIISLNGHPPTADLVKSNAYPFWNIEHMYTKGQPDAVEQAFLNYVYSDAPRQIQHSFKGFLALSDITPQMLKARNAS